MPISMKNFSQHLQQQNIAESTAKLYTREVNHYLNFLSAQEKQATNASKKDLLNYLQQTDEKRNINRGTKLKLVGTLKHYYNYLNQEFGTENITHHLKIRGGKKKQIRELFATEELELLTEGYYYEHQERLKEYLILCFTCFQALRIAEINRITPDDVDVRKGTIRIQSSKKIRERTLILQPVQIASLMQYFNQNQSFKISNNDKDKLFNTLRKLDSKFQDFTQVRSSVITTWIKIHGLRKAQYFAGHKYIGSTEEHLAGEFESLQKDLEMYHPLEKV